LNNIKKGEIVEYQNLIMKFLSEEISEAELVKLKLWIENNKENRKLFDEINEIWRETNIGTKHNYFNPEKAWEILSIKLGLGKSRDSSVKVVSKNFYRILISAASVACILALGGMSLYLGLKSSIKHMAGPITIVATNEGEKSHIYLSDSTKVYLNSGSRLEYDGQFNIKDRVVKLNGEAYFEVQTNPEKPFIVQTGKVKVTASGTRFNVFSYDNENRVETTLEEGKLEVSVIGKESSNVTPGHQVVYFKDSQEIKILTAAPDTYTSWIENKLRFYDTPFEEVMRTISRRYNVKIEIKNRDLLNLTYSATFIDESIEEIMKYLEKVSPITYKIYFQTSVKDKTYTKPKIEIGLRKKNMTKL
jgi:transmembrane sensor